MEVRVDAYGSREVKSDYVGINNALTYERA